MDSFFGKVESFFKYDKQEIHSHSHHGHECDELHPEEHAANRFQSFAGPSTGNAKWFVDGCSYFWAVSEALERAEESIFILDWWLSPEVYLRRPPSKNERYRLDAMLKAAAERGVKVYIIVYKEVEAALTLNSIHTKHALEALHRNIRVFRHPDHVPTGYNLASELGGKLNNLTNFDILTASRDAVKALYGATGEVVLFWAHHEKLLVVDGKLAFMGGLDLCFGRWDTSSHPIADAHPGNLDEIIFPGQDYNNARIFDFSDVGNWDQNKLDRTKSSRMGWSDVALCLNGHIVTDLISHFVDRWNFIFDVKYGAKDPGKYERLPQYRSGTPGHSGEHQSGRLIRHFAHSLAEGMENLGFSSHDDYDNGPRHHSNDTTRIQLTRSCGKWSSGHPTEHSIANAYVHAITNAEHFVYIENQFFITATSDEQRPVKNKIGAAIVDRIIRAHEERQEFKVWVVMPAVPAFAGDLKSKGALGTRAIMEFQYNSISRGKNSILEKLRTAGIEDPGYYIGFYNLRNFDRINTSKTMQEAEQRAGVSYEDARREHDDYVGASRYSGNEDYRSDRYDYEHYDRYQRGTHRVRDTTLDTVSSCCMYGSPDVIDIPWDGEPEDEINAFVSEQLYIHSKLLIADDRLVICGSANLNDRSQLGFHDSEIAVVIEGPTTVGSYMNGRSYNASEFATSLRRYIFRKHLGLLRDQRWDKPDQNWHPITQAPNGYDWGSRADLLVQDPLSPDFLDLWEDTAVINTEVFSRAFHPVPDNKVRTWEAYDDFFSKYFIIPDGKKKPCGDDGSQDGKVEYGHIVREEFPGGVKEVKKWLSRVRGTLVNMPLDFLVDVPDIAEDGLTLNGLTDELYT